MRSVVVVQTVTINLENLLPILLIKMHQLNNCHHYSSTLLTSLMLCLVRLEECEALQRNYTTFK